jgi:hypothetical protein
MQLLSNQTHWTLLVRTPNSYGHGGRADQVVPRCSFLIAASCRPPLMTFPLTWSWMSKCGKCVNQYPLKLTLKKKCWLNGLIIVSIRSNLIYLLLRTARPVIPSLSSLLFFIRPYTYKDLQALSRPHLFDACFSRQWSSEFLCFVCRNLVVHKSSCDLFTQITRETLK